MEPATVLPLPHDAFERVLCVVAHPDDIEYGTSAAVAAWTTHGVEVAYLLLTRGEAGMDASPPDRTGPMRVREQVAGSEAVGVTAVEFLDDPDGVLEYGLDLRRDIARPLEGHRGYLAGIPGHPEPRRILTGIQPCRAGRWGRNTPCCSGPETSTRHRRSRATPWRRPGTRD